MSIELEDLFRQEGVDTSARAGWDIDGAVRQGTQRRRRRRALTALGSVLVATSLIAGVTNLWPGSNTSVAPAVAPPKSCQTMSVVSARTTSSWVVDGPRNIHHVLGYEPLPLPSAPKYAQITGTFEGTIPPRASIDFRLGWSSQELSPFNAETLKQALRTYGISLHGQPLKTEDWPTYDDFQSYLKGKHFDGSHYWIAFAAAQFDRIDAKVLCTDSGVRFDAHVEDIHPPVVQALNCDLHPKIGTAEEYGAFYCEPVRIAKQSGHAPDKSLVVPYTLP